MNGKVKGGQYERDICRKLSLWISGGKDENLLWRSAMSGGRATLAHKKGKANKEQLLDISAVSPEGHRLIDKACIECKFYKNLGLAKFFMGLPSPLTTFWEETKKSAKAGSKLPVLIAKQNYFPDIIVFDQFLFSALSPREGNSFLAITKIMDKTATIINVSFLEDFLSNYVLA